MIEPCQKVRQHRERMARLREKYHFDEVRAKRSCDWIERNIRQWKAPYTGLPLILSDWQRRDVFEPLFGFYRSNGQRLFTEAYLQIPRKNGKTAMAAAAGLLIFTTEGSGLECYTAACTRDQAMIAYSDVREYVRSSPQMRKKMRVRNSPEHVRFGTSVFRPLSGQDDNLDGLNVQCAIVDELHQHRDDGLLNVLLSAKGARESPMVLMITTAGAGETGVGREYYRLSSKVLAGEVELDHFFCLVYEADDELEWDSDEAYRQANPNLNVSVSEDELREFRDKSRLSPDVRRAYERYHLNRWVAVSSHRWLDLDRWAACQRAVSEDTLRRCRCWAGFDLSAVGDLTSFGLVWLLPDGHLYLRNWYWRPGETLLEAIKSDKVPYDQWHRDGWLRLSDGAAVDYKQLEEDIADLCERYKPVAVSYDSWHAPPLVQPLEKRCAKYTSWIEFPQTSRYYHAPSTEFERRILTGKIHHDGNPITRWCVGNVHSQVDTSGKIRPVKEFKMSPNRIDGVVAAIMGLDAQMRAPTKKGPDLGRFLAAGDIRGMLGA